MKPEKLFFKMIMPMILVLLIVLIITIYTEDDPKKPYQQKHKTPTPIVDRAEERRLLIESFLAQMPNLKEENIQITFDDKGVPHIAVSGEVTVDYDDQGRPTERKGE